MTAAFFLRAAADLAWPASLPDVDGGFAFGSVFVDFAPDGLALGGADVAVDELTSFCSAEVFAEPDPTALAWEEVFAEPDPTVLAWEEVLVEPDRTALAWEEVFAELGPTALAREEVFAEPDPTALALGALLIVLAAICFPRGCESCS